MPKRREARRPARGKRPGRHPSARAPRDARPQNVLYLEGDRCAVKFLTGAMQNAGISFERPDRATAAAVARADAILLSDWPARRLPAAVQAAIVQRVSEGAHLLMVGGWTSLGRGGYAGTKVGDLLPVTLEDGDDRHGCVHGAFPYVTTPAHPALADFDVADPPVICGYNRVRPKPGAQVLMESREIEPGGESPTLSTGRAPLLVAGRSGAGTVVVYASDLAPHWSGGLTDWGTPLPAPEGEEVGDRYVRFVASLLALSPRQEAGATRIRRTRPLARA